MLTNALRASGRVTASLDIEFWKKYVKRRARRGCPMGLTRNPLDLLEPSGFALLGFIHVHMLQVLLEAWWAGLPVLVLLLRLVVTMLLQAKKEFVLMIGFPCSTWVAMSRASTGRHFFRPLGNRMSEKVEFANVLASRLGSLIAHAPNINSCMAMLFIMLGWCLSWNFALPLAFAGASNNRVLPY